VNYTVIDLKTSSAARCYCWRENYAFVEKEEQTKKEKA